MADTRRYLRATAALVVTGVVIFLVSLIWGPEATSKDAPLVYADYYRTFGTEGPGKLEDPAGIAVAEDGRVFVADRATDQIMLYEPDGDYIGSFGGTGEGGGQLREPTFLTLDSYGLLYVVDRGNQRISVFRPEGAFVRHIDDPSLNEPAGVAINRENKIYVSDTGDDEIQVLTRMGKPISTCGYPGLVFPGGLNSPGDIEWLNDDAIWVSDEGNERLQLFRHEETEEIAGWGLFGLAFAMDAIAGIGIDSVGRIFAADPYEELFFVYDADGTPLGTIGTPGSGEGEFDDPWDIEFRGNRGYVLDRGNQRVQIWRFQNLKRAGARTEEDEDEEELEPTNIENLSNPLYPEVTRP